MKVSRNSLIYFVLLFIIIPVGYASRLRPELFSPFFAEYLGDPLWTAMIYFGLCLIFPRMSVLKLFAITLSFCYFIEISQLCQEPWLIAIRATTIGALILGHGFLWSDIICYTIGALFAAAVDYGIISINKKMNSCEARRT
jgi:hypothetical protein